MLNPPGLSGEPFKGFWSQSCNDFTNCHHYDFMHDFSVHIIILCINSWRKNTTNI